MPLDKQSDEQQRPPRRVEIKVNLQVMAGKLQRILQHAIDLAGFGLHAKDQVQEEFEPLRTVVTFNPAADAALSVDQAKQRFTRWLVAAQLRDVIEGFKSYLDEVRLVCAVYELSSEDSISLSDWDAATVKERKRFHRMGLPHKIDELRERFGESVAPKSLDMVLTFNQARNCLVHRHGVVAQQDANDGDGLTVSWLAQEIGVEAPDGTETMIAELPFVAEEGGRVFMRQRPETRTFPVGEEVLFTAQEFAEICWTLFVVCNEVNQGVEAYGRSIGVTFPDAQENARTTESD